MAKTVIPTSGQWSTIAGFLNSNFDQPDICRIGWYNYNDQTTSTTPIAVTSGVPVYLTNDATGTLTQKQEIVGTTEIWDSVTNAFDFSDFKNGDMVNIRVDLEVTTTAANQKADLFLEAGIGGFNYDIQFASGQFKTAGVNKVGRYNFIAIFDDNTRLNPAKFRFESDGNASIKVLGWLIKCETRGL